MKFYGMAPLTLLDLPGKVACTCFTGGCNLRCPFCHNAGLVLNPTENTPIDEEEIFAYLEKRRGVLDGICISGGEPLLQKELPAFLERLRQTGLVVKLDTNGCFPAALASLLEKKCIGFVAMDIKNAPEAYGETVGIPGFDPAPVAESLALLRQYNVDFELRTTVIKPLHTKERLLSLARWIGPVPAYYLQNFVDSGNLICQDGLSGYTPGEMEELLRAIRPLQPNAALRGV